MIFSSIFFLSFCLSCKAKLAALVILSQNLCPFSQAFFALVLSVTSQFIYPSENFPIYLELLHKRYKIDPLIVENSQEQSIPTCHLVKAKKLLNEAFCSKIVFLFIIISHFF